MNNTSDIKDGNPIARALLAGEPYMLAKTLSVEVNNLCFKARDVIDYIKQMGAEKEMAAFAAMWIRETADDFRMGNYDARNEDSSKTAAMLVEHSVDRLLVSAFEPDKKQRDTAAEAAAHLKREHRTIKQSISSLCFAFVKNAAQEMEHNGDNSIRKAIDGAFHDNGSAHAAWDRCPLIF